MIENLIKLPNFGSFPHELRRVTQTHFFFMLRKLVFLLLAITCVYGNWPRPTLSIKGSNILLVNPDTFHVNVSVEIPILNRAIQRYMTQALFFPFTVYNTPPDAKLIQNLFITVANSSEELQLGVDESYQLFIEQEHSYQVFMYTNTVWGALRGLETFSQLIEFNLDTRQYSINCVPFEIEDAPRFPWRGLMIDTSRHYLVPRTILRVIDAMSYSKFNTLHWHVVDAESFPLVVPSFPLLSEKGTWSPVAIYPPKFIEFVVAYAKDRGIRVVIEIDMPGHAYSWGYGYPQIIANCPTYMYQKDTVPLNPTLNETYTVVNGVLNQVKLTTLDNYMHLGGDEVQYGCMQEDPSIQAWMTEHNITNVDTLGQIFQTQLEGIMNNLSRSAVHWEDIWNYGFPAPSNTIFQVYSSVQEVQAMLNANVYTINSYGWYLDVQSPLSQDTYEWVDTWQQMWQFDPLIQANVSESTYQYFLGGEALMWGDQVDDVCIDSRVWPRACAIAERLWSQSYDLLDTYGAKSRLIDFRCRLARRGIGAGPIDPGYCPLPRDFDVNFFDII